MNERVQLPQFKPSTNHNATSQQIGQYLEILALEPRSNVLDQIKNYLQNVSFNN